MTMSEPQSLVGMAEEVEKMLSRMTPCSDADFRAAQLKQDILPRMAGLGFPDRFRNEIVDWRCKPQEDVFRLCMDTCQENGAIVALAGIRGAGKTTIAAQMAIVRARNWLDHYREQKKGRPLGMPHYVKAVDLIARYKSIYADYGSTDSERLTEDRDWQCREWSLLVIDELHECQDQRLIRVVTDIVDRRYSAKTDTMLITNQTAKEFQDTASESILSRLSEHGRIIPCNWKSWRTKK